MAPDVIQPVHLSTVQHSTLPHPGILLAPPTSLSFQPANKPSTNSESENQKSDHRFRRE